MITPAVLISACGALIFSTSSRLGRVIDRVRALSAKFEQIAKHPEDDEMFEERRALIFSQLDRQTSRARLIQRAMTAYYTALGVFVAATVIIAITAASPATSPGSPSAWASPAACSCSTVRSCSSSSRGWRSGRS